MNTMPQTFDPRPWQASAGAPPGARVPHRRAQAALKLVVDRLEATPAPVPVPAAALRTSFSYGLQGRRHLAGVLRPQPQAASGGADPPILATRWSRPRLEPVAFAPVLLASVAALAVMLRAG
jgi:hypothetical protein